VIKTEQPCAGEGPLITLEANGRLRWCRPEGEHVGLTPLLTGGVTITN
jgi:hypothetical protein